MSSFKGTVASILLNRNFIGIENDQVWFDVAKERMELKQEEIKKENIFFDSFKE
jgi:DNA modification methylase